MRGPWEVRLVRVTGLAAEAGATGIRVGGWPIAGDDPTETTIDGGTIVSDGRVSSGLRMLQGAGTAHVERRTDASPLGAITSIPFIDLPVAVGTWAAVLVTLSGALADETQAAIELTDESGTLAMSVTWPDGHRTTHHLTDPQPDATTPVAATVGHRDRAQG